jgi:hypothetical protein
VGLLSERRSGISASDSGGPVANGQNIGGSNKFLLHNAVTGEILLDSI